MIARFENQYAFLSNFYESPMTVDGITYPTVEHFFQAQKTLNIQERSAIAAASTPGRAKRMGRNVSLRPDWENVKEEIMRIGLEKKFSKPILKAKLLATDNEILVEGNWWHDNYWGSCNCAQCGNRGKNTLGNMLMTLREKLRKN